MELSKRFGIPLSLPAWLYDFGSCKERNEMNIYFFIIGDSLFRTSEKEDKFKGGDTNLGKGSKRCIILIDTTLTKLTITTSLNEWGSVEKDERDNEFLLNIYDILAH